MRGFTAREASRLAGFEKPWTLNHLEREEIFVPDQKRARQQGKYRSYTFRDVVVLRAINRMLKLGARPRRVRDSIETFLSICPPAEGEDALLKFARQSSFFVVTDKAVLFCESPIALTNLAMKGQLAFSFMVDNRSAIGPSVEAGLFYLGEIQKGKKRDADLLELAASRFGL